MFFTSRTAKLVENIEKLKQLEKKLNELNEENKELYRLIINKEDAIQKIIAEKSQAFPWLADAISEFHKLQDFDIVKYLEEKKHPAFKKADAVRQIALDNKMLRKQLFIAQNFVKYYESLFPWITDYVGNDLDELIEGVIQTELEDDETDPVLHFIQKAEYQALSTSERNQRALDRYLSSRKKPYQIGRDYERYIGYLYEEEGYKVEYVGIEKGLEDLGRDLICTKGSETEIVQCKYWANHKTIHEKHINQLYGTAVKYFIDHKNIQTIRNSMTLFPDLMNIGQIKATFITSTKLSETARKFASALGVKVIESKPLRKYPLIKCNITSTGNKIYHLPFDQQYDKVLIKNKGEFYASTVKEAEEKGFRRAFKWQGSLQ
jgi:hypothetical protein